jgi:hypothetical protein
MRSQLVQNKHRLVGCVVDVWCPEGEQLIERCAVRARINNINIRHNGSMLFRIAPLRIWAAGSRAWCWHSQGSILKHYILDARSCSDSEWLYSCRLLLPSAALELALLNGRIAIIYPKDAFLPSDPGKFLLRENRSTAVLF